MSILEHYEQALYDDDESPREIKKDAQKRIGTRTKSEGMERLAQGWVYR